MRKEIYADISENLKIAVNSNFSWKRSKFSDPQVRLSFNGSSGHMVVKRADSEKFICLIAPINLTEDS